MANSSFTKTSVTAPLSVPNGGTGKSTLTGILVGNGTGPITTITAPGGYVVGTTDTQTLTNKRIIKRTDSTASSATPTINTDNVDMYLITALAAAITSFTTNLSGSPTEGQTLLIVITDDGTPRAITWGASFENGAVTLPSTTVASTRLDVFFVWNSVTAKWRCMSAA
jgi:hypothetical protein